MDHWKVLLESSNQSSSTTNEDAENLPLLQPIWELFLRNSAYTGSPLFPIVVGVLSFFACLVPYSFLDYWGRDWDWVRRCKIQPDVTVTWKVTRQAIALTCWNQVLYVLPVSVAQCVWTPETSLPALAPGVIEFVWHHYAALVVMDAMFYAWHVIHHHNRFLYRHVHSVHHTYHTINCWVVQYLHPWELICVGLFGTVAPWILRCHPLTTWSFMVFLNFLSIDEHCGYSFPLAPHNWIPFYGGALKHDMHHFQPLTNLQPYFIWFDHLFDNHRPADLKTRPAK